MNSNICNKRSIKTKFKATWKKIICEADINSYNNNKKSGIG